MYEYISSNKTISSVANTKTTTTHKLIKLL